ncbi:MULTISPECIES: hypothetical protein [Microbacterium]|uniref:hypothetical protein n=1 Tax=Microbacterium TaxID=33882 RepID=UPI00226E92AA|nr:MULTISPECIES: hypothetical protein [Microbacterium]MDZ5144537.1 hypothetical protein [Microbacterium testaceum]WAC69353.1 hypothetical protein OVA17_01245 [Microbacterium sp. SL75]
MSKIDFLGPLHDEFESGYLKELTLRYLRPLERGVEIEFSSSSPFPGVFRILVPLPELVGDETWNAFDDTTTSVREWTRWGIAVPVQEAYDTQAQSGLVDDRGITTLHMP